MASLLAREPRPDLYVLLRNEAGEPWKFFFDTHEYHHARERCERFGRVEILNKYISDVVGHLSTAMAAVDPKNGEINYRAAFMALHSTSLVFVSLAIEYKFFNEDDRIAGALAKNTVFEILAEEAKRVTIIADKCMRLPVSDQLTKVLIESGFREQVRELYATAGQHLMLAYNEELADATRIPRP